jgi:hypothetical protein
MRVETLGSEATAAGFDERIGGGPSRSAEVERDAGRPTDPSRVHELGAMVDPDRCRQSHLSPDSFRHLDDVIAAEGEAPVGSA